ncbi:ferredoxin [Streptococcaceae bacterium ESL0729]|nr:ferredoxin [Streptococcaceae bacterium ESL0729]
MKIKILPDKCIACGLCHSLAPTIFDYHDNGIVKFYESEADLIDLQKGSEESEAKAAIKECPTHAIIRP